jgi:hypothetical protein
MKTDKTFSKLMQTYLQETKNFKAIGDTEITIFIEKVYLNIFRSCNVVSIYFSWICAAYFILRSCLNNF